MRYIRGVLDGNPVGTAHLVEAAAAPPHTDIGDAVRARLAVAPAPPAAPGRGHFQ